MQTNRDKEAAPVTRYAWRFRIAAALLFAAVVLAVAGAFAMGWHRELSLGTVVRYRAAIQAMVADQWLTALAAHVAIYTVAAGCSLPGVVFLTIGGGAVFGGLAGGLAAVLGATAGATAVFLLARSAIGTVLVRWAGPLAERLAGGFREDAFNYLLFMRLVPLFPFFLVNLVPALCGVSLATFVAATAVGIVPVTFAFAFFGAGLDSIVAAQVAQYQSCLSEGGSDCRLDFDLRMVFTPQFVAGLGALAVAALIPIALRRYNSVRARKP